MVARLGDKSQNRYRIEDGELGEIMSEFKHSITLTGDKVVESGEGFNFTWGMMSKVVGEALLDENHMTKDEVISQIDLHQGGVRFVIKEK